jgi:hypothetical protein
MSPLQPVGVSAGKTVTRTIIGDDVRMMVAGKVRQHMY